MWDIPRLWDGGQCVIIGGGPSVTQQFDIPEYLVHQVYTKKASPEVYSPYMQSIHSQHIIAVNMAFKLGPWIDCAFFGDEVFYTNYRWDLYQFKGLRVTCASALPSQNGFLKILDHDREHKFGCSFKPGHVSWNGNSGAAAINLAVHFGVKRIILLGFDMKLDSNQNQHWHKFYTSNPQSVAQRMKLHLQGFPVIAKDLHGKVEIINACPDSMITSFPRMAFKDIRL